MKRLTTLLCLGALAGCSSTTVYKTEVLGDVDSDQREKDFVACRDFVTNELFDLETTKIDTTEQFSPFDLVALVPGAELATVVGAQGAEAVAAQNEQKDLAPLKNRTEAFTNCLAEKGYRIKRQSEKQ